MKRYCYFLLAVFCSMACKGQTQKDKRDGLFKQNLVRNKVHFINVYEYEYKSGTVDSTTRFLANSDEYDSNGNLITQLIYHRKNSTEYRPTDSTINVFDGNGNLIKGAQIKHELSQDSSKSFIRYVTVFDNTYVHNKKSESLIYRDGKLDGRIKYEFNSEGDLTTATVYDNRGTLETKTTNTYVNSEKTGSKTLDRNNRIKYRSEIIIKDKYNTINTTFKGNDQFFSVQDQQLDAKGQIAVDKFKMKGFQIINKYTYNDWGALTSNTVYYDGEHKLSQYKKIEMVKFE